jgi:hypothetical protein
MKRIIAPGLTNVIDRVFVQDMSQTSSIAGLTGLAFNSTGLTWYYSRVGDTGSTQVSPASAVLGTFTSGGFKEIDSINMPGWYEIGIPNAVFAVGSKAAHMTIKGAANMPVIPIEIELDASRPYRNLALSKFQFVMTDSTNHNPRAGLTVAASRNIDNAGFASCANVVTDVANGWYSIDLAATDLNGNVIALRFTATGADDNNLTLITQG